MERVNAIKQPDYLGPTGSFYSYYSPFISNQGMGIQIRSFLCVGLKSLNFWLNGKRSIGGYSLIHALFGKVGIVSPEALGVKMSASEAKAINKYQQERNQRRNADDNNSKQGRDDDV